MRKNLKILVRAEFVAAFRRLYAFVFLALYWGVLAYLMIRYNISYTNSDMSAVLSSMSVASAVLIPILTLFGGLGGYGKRQKPFVVNMLDAMPFSRFERAAAKMFANLSIIGIATAPLLFVPIINGYFGVTDYLGSYSFLLVFAVFEIMILAISQYISVKVKSDVAAILANYGTFVGVFLIGSAKVLIPRSAVVSFVAVLVIALLVAWLLFKLTKNKLVSAVACGVLFILPIPFFFIARKSFEGLFEKIVESLSIFRRFDLFSVGVFDLTAIILFVAVAAAFILLTFKAVGKKRIGRVILLKAVSAVICALMIFSVFSYVVPIGIVALDSTQNGKYSISKTTKDFLKDLDAPVTLYYINPTSTEESLTAFLQRYSAIGDTLTLKEVYPSTDADFFEKYGVDPTKIEAGSVLVASEMRAALVYPSDMFTYTNDEFGFTDMDSTTYMQYLYYAYMYAESDPDTYNSLLYDTVTCFKGDAIITRYIEHVTEQSPPTVFFLKGHDEAEFSDILWHYFNQFDSPEVYGFVTEELEISDSVPDNAKAIFINCPKTDISDSEYDILSAYLSSGGQITLLTDDNAAELENLCKLLADYGMSASDKALEMPEDAQISINANHSITATLSDITDEAVALNEPISIVFDNSADESLLLTPLVTYSEKAAAEGECATVHSLAAAAETADGSRLVWITGAKDFDAHFGENANVEMLVCAASWTSMIYESELRAVAPVIYAYPTREIDSALATVFKVLFVSIAIIPLGYGIFDFIRRKKRSDNK